MSFPHIEGRFIVDHTCNICLQDKKEIAERGHILKRCTHCTSSICSECIVKLKDSSCVQCLQKQHQQLIFLGNPNILKENISLMKKDPIYISQKKLADNGNPFSIFYICMEELKFNGGLITDDIFYKIKKAADHGSDRAAVEFGGILVDKFKSKIKAHFIKKNSYKGINLKLVWDAIKYLQNNYMDCPATAANKMTMFSRIFYCDQKFPTNNYMEIMCWKVISACKHYKVSIPCAYCDGNSIKDLRRNMPSSLTGGINNWCSGCGIVRYCNSTCQRKHWKSHKCMCKAKRFVEIQGLVNSTKYNGKVGYIKGLKEGKYVVVIEGKKILVNPFNFVRKYMPSLI